MPNTGYTSFSIIKEFNVVFLRRTGPPLTECTKADFRNVVPLNFTFFTVELNTQSRKSAFPVPSDK